MYFYKSNFQKIAMLGALQGLKILDFTRLLPGPLATMLMADMGAEVIKIESPTQKDSARDFPPFIAGESAAYLAYNRSKKSLCIDYSQEKGREIVLRLVQEADILIEQFRPTMMQRWGLDYETLHAVNPRLVYVSVTGYGQTGAYSQWAGHDLNYIALAGLLGGNENEAPQIPQSQIADIAGGSYMAVIACLSAIVSRATTGKGQWVDVAMLDAVMPLNITAMMFQWATKMQLPREKGVLSGGLVNYNVYKASDAYVAVGALEAKFWAKFCELIGKPDWKNRVLPTKTEILAQHKAELASVLASKTAQEWHDLGLQHDIPISKIHDINDLEQDAHLQARQMVIEMEHPKAGKLKSIGVPLKFSETPASPTWTAPRLGAHTREILMATGYSEAQIQAWAEEKLVVV